MTRPVVTLTTDFGTHDPYVAAMKGVICSRCSEAQILDLSHEIPPQDVRGAALFLAAAVPWFPPRTVHVAVVDPGVGTARRPLALHVGGQFLVGPDNGIFSLLLDRLPLQEARELQNPAWQLKPLSATFHGRDIFAPAAAYLASGGEWEQLGPAIHDIAREDLPPPVRTADGWRGQVIHIDRFGNCITNLTAEQHQPGATLQTAGQVLPLSRAYGAVGVGERVALLGSSGYIEVAVRNGNAASALGLVIGAPVDLCHK